MSSFSFLKTFSMSTFDMPAIYWNRFTVEFTKYFAVSDCNALFILSFFIQLVAALHNPGRCLAACWPRTLTVRFFITFLTKSKISRPLCQPLRLLFLVAAFWVYLHLIVTFAGNWALDTCLYCATKVWPLGNVTFLGVFILIMKSSSFRLILDSKESLS